MQHNMADLYTRIIDSYNFLIYELCDDRTRDNWPNFGTLVVIIICYLHFSTKSGPAWMRDRTPFDLTNIIFYYNIFQIIASSYLFSSGFVYYLQYNKTCQPIVYENNPMVEGIHTLVWLYMILKLIDLFDTIFFVLRKKNRQISGLHLYHHTMMPFAAYLCLKYIPNGHALVLGPLNCFVHIFMYTYYLIAGLNSKNQKVIWWKKYITVLQLVQFLLILIHNIIPLFIGCNYPKWINILLCINSVLFIYMFGKFYYLTYVKCNTNNHSSDNVFKRD